MPYGSLAFAKPAFGALAAMGSRLAYRLKAKTAARTKTTQKWQRRPKWPSAGMRPMAFPKLTMARGLNKDFVFCFDGQLNTATTAGIYGVEDVFKLNDCFDPAVGGATNQPLYWDQYTALYSRYRVHSATVEIRWMTTDVVNITACTIKIAGSNDAVTIFGKGTAYIAEMPLSNTIRIAPGGEHTYLVGPRHTNMAFIEGEKWFTKADDYTALTSASPAATPRIRMAAANLTSATQLGTHYHIRITYHVHLFEPKTPNESV